MTPTLHTPFPATWTAEILERPPLIAPARHFIYPEPVPGEEDALARGALLLHVKPRTGGPFLATCALGFRDPSVPSGVWSCPNPNHLLALAGGYAYLIDTTTPERAQHLALRPVTAILPATEAGLLVLAGFHTVMAIAATGPTWTTSRLSHEGLTQLAICDNQLHGYGWNMLTDRELPFTIDLSTGQHTGGAI